MTKPNVAAASTLTSKLSDSRFIVGAVIFVLSFLVFKLSPNHQMYDSQFTILLADNLLRHGDFQLDRYHLPSTIEADGSTSPQYRLEQIHGHVYYRFPPGSALLSVPFVAAMRVLGLSVVRPDGSYDADADERLNARLSSLVAAAFIALLFVTARLVLPLLPSVVFAFVAAFGSQVYSSASRALGSDTWGCLLMGAVVFLLLRSELRARPPNGFALGALASIAYVVRPTNALGTIGLAIYLAVKHRRTLPPFLAAAALVLGSFVVYSLVHFGAPLPGYFVVSQLGQGGVLVALLGHLVSPSRGLFTCVPAVVLVLLLTARLWAQIRFPSLARLALAVTGAHLLVIAYYRGWGGHSFGARLSTGMLPWLALLAILAVDVARDGRLGRTRRIIVVLGTIACGISVAINTVGAVSPAAAEWNSWPIDVDLHAQRIWDWRYPQFLAPVVVPTEPYVPLPDQGIRMGSEAAAPYLGSGWSYPEGSFRWTDGSSARLRFAGRKPTPDGLEIVVGPHLAPGRIDRQRLRITLNGRTLFARDLVTSGFTAYFLPLPPGSVVDENTLALSIPDAAAPDSEHQSKRPRLLGVAVQSLRWAPAPMIPDDGIRMGGDPAPYLHAGWSRREGEFRWTEEPEAEVRFAGERPPPEGLEVDLRPYLVPGRLERQHAEAWLNQRRVWSADLTDDVFAWHRIAIAPESIGAENTLRFVLPNAASPRGLQGLDDDRRLGIAVRTIRRARNAVAPEIWMGAVEATPYLGGGWGKPEGEFRWTDGPSASISFDGENTVPDSLEVQLRPYLVENLVRRQRVLLVVNDREVWRAELTTGELRTHTIPLPAGCLRGRNVLIFQLPDATSPRAVNGSNDDRKLGIAVRAIHRARHPW